MVLENVWESGDTDVVKGASCSIRSRPGRTTSAVLQFCRANKPMAVVMRACLISVFLLSPRGYVSRSPSQAQSSAAAVGPGLRDFPKKEVGWGSRLSKPPMGSRCEDEDEKGDGLIKEINGARSTGTYLLPT